MPDAAFEQFVRSLRALGDARWDALTHRALAQKGDRLAFARWVEANHAVADARRRLEREAHPDDTGAHRENTWESGLSGRATFSSGT